MLKNIARLEQQIGDKIYHFSCDHDSPIEHIKQALVEFISFATQAGKASQPVAPPSTPVEEAIKTEEPKV